MGGFSFAAERPIEKYHKSDILFLISVILLWGLGFFALFICSQNYAQRMFDDSFYFVKRQFITSCVGGVLFLFFLLSDMKLIRKLVSIIVISAFVLCLLTFIPGISVEKNGAARWIRLPFSFSFQPSELVKFGLVLFLANYFSDRLPTVTVVRHPVLQNKFLFFLYPEKAQSRHQRSHGLHEFPVTALYFPVPFPPQSGINPFPFHADVPRKIHVKTA